MIMGSNLNVSSNKNRKNIHFVLLENVYMSSFSPEYELFFSAQRSRLLASCKGILSNRTFFSSFTFFDYCFHKISSFSVLIKIITRG